MLVFRGKPRQLLLIFTFLIIFLSALPFANSVVFVSPMGGENITAGSIFYVNWTNQGEDHYQLWYTTDNSKPCDGTWTLVEPHPYPNVGCNCNVSYNWSTPLINSTTVRFQVEGHNSSDDTINRTCSATFAVMSVPSPPQNLTGVALNNSAINISWASFFSYEIVIKYLIYRNGINIANTTNNSTFSYVDSGLNSSTQYNYTVRAMNHVGMSDFSNSLIISTLADNPPAVTLNAPVNGFNSNSSIVNFNCSANDDIGLVNVTLYGNWSSGWHANETRNWSGISNSTTFTKTIADGNYIWNCQVFDTFGNAAFASSNRTFTVDTTAPIVTLLAPANNSVWNSSSTVNFSYNVTDANDISSCSILINGLVNKTNTSVSKNVVQNFIINLANGVYNWSVRCNDTAGNIGNSSTYTLSVSVSGGGSGSDNGGAGGGGASVIVKSPNGGETILAGSTYNITWISSGVAHFEIYYSKDSGKSWELVQAHPYGTSSTTSYSWKVPNIESCNVRVRVDGHDSNHNTIARDTSNADFCIKNITSSDAGKEANQSVRTGEEEKPLKKEIKIAVGEIKEGEERKVLVETEKVKEIVIKAKKKIIKAEIEVKELLEKPKDVKNLSGKVFGYLNISLLNASEGSIESASITFGVNTSWLAENNIDDSTIALNKLKDGEWIRLNTTLASKTAEKYYYTAQTESFSIFAISGEEKILREDEKSVQKNKTASKSRFLTIIIVLILIVLIGAFIFFYYKSKKERAEPNFERYFFKTPSI
jgi:PGF-pre-PGF domain-containing protein